jgi:hypothetical protein
MIVKVEGAPQRTREEKSNDNLFQLFSKDSSKPFSSFNLMFFSNFSPF